MIINLYRLLYSKQMLSTTMIQALTAGEGDIEVAKVNCLHSATTGYAPLIFDLDKKSNCKIFLDKCESVWKELAADVKLPNKLVDTNRHLEWLKNVKHAHGSVEVTSLSQAEAINSLGIYCVGNIQQAATEQKCVCYMINS
ncbi:hypothetical protein KUTeg_007058 [Tegillarca granosa]|uniref:Uncharacterized protein n=1 Tax=Tegillarca granosa TaxID=220873 RepID=A0ABQ9FGU1_TEGGR|nr:hypothetical protein KUTeg_007058 [Tegillarca granosa]